jgi:cellulose synthase/poly-beta-1,6-N-acetylglucosamine synthase-like glycosyltransferase
MLEFLGYLIFSLYMVALVYVTIFCLMQIHLLLKYNKAKRSPKDNIAELEVLPMVTVQLPVYNERYVIERLIDQIIKLDYPKEKLEIQILDDSSDETTDLARAKVEHYRSLGYDIHLVRRPVRSGFKAGALQYGLERCKGEFVAIFDADFLPRPQFLRSTLGYFTNPEIGVVQTKWEHLNQDYSIITELQAFQLNVHFTVEQVGREHAGYFLQFNGTAGVWRKETITDAGGWQADTLTEDLDLSFRAQLHGWKIHYIESLGSPAELPAEMNGLKSQQFRWMKGGAETAKKMIPTVWRSDLGWSKKFHATVHLLSSAVFLFVFALGIFSVPLIFFLSYLKIDPIYMSIFLIGMLSIISVYYVANVRSSWDDISPFRAWIKFLFLFPLFLALSMGLSLHNSIAVIQGYIGKKSAFIRTPKFNIVSLKDTVNKKNYLNYKLNWTTIMEGILTIYFAMAFWYGLTSGLTTFLVFHLLLAMGFGTIFYFSVSHLGLRK